MEGCVRMQLRKRAIIDLRERILNGEHPRNEVFN